MKQSKTLRRWELALLLGVACAALLGVWLDGAQAALSDQVIRLHVLANSDSEADQALKLRVRDRILAEAEELFVPGAGRAETEALGGISLHYFDGEDWTAEKTYGIYLSSGQAADLTELTMEVWPPHGGRTGTYDAALHG